MFFIAKSLFWLSIVAMAMPDTALDAAGGRSAMRALVTLKSPAALQGLAGECLANSACRSAFMAVVVPGPAAQVQKSAAGKPSRTIRPQPLAANVPNTARRSS